MNTHHPRVPSCIEMLETRIAPATFIVTSLQDSGPGTLRQAIFDAESAPGADEIIFQKQKSGAPVALKGTIVLKSELPAITDEVTIHDPFVTDAGKQNVKINGNTQRIFVIRDIADGESVTVADLALTNGVSRFGGAIYVTAVDGSVTLSNLLVSKNRAVGLYSREFAFNRSALGGGICIESGSVVLEGSKVIGNSAVGNKGHATDDPEAGGLRGGPANGGGIYVAKGAQLVVQDSLISNNVAIGGNAARGVNGGRIFFGGTAYYWHASDGTSGGDASGGGIANKGDLTLEGTTIVSNVAKGGIGARGGNGELGKGLTRSETYDGGTGGEGGDALGGGVENSGNATVIGSIILSNKSLAGVGGGGGTGGFPGYDNSGGSGGLGGTAKGGGISNNSGTLTMETSTVAGNRATGAKGGLGGAGGPGGDHGSNNNKINKSLGGGVSSYLGSLALTQVTVAGNSANLGGGVHVDESHFTEIKNSTIARNVAAGTAGVGGGLWIKLNFENAPVTMISSIVGQNAGRSNPDIQGSIVSNHNLIQNSDGVDFGGVIDPDTIVGMSPLLGTLKSNGGPTPTLLPAAQSPAINKGTNPDILTFDQRGMPRVLPLEGGTVDIGSVEVA